jgi:hypothetical protein
VKSTDHEALPYAVFFILLSFHPLSVQISSSAPCFQTPPVYVPPLMPETKFHLLEKRQEIVSATAISILTITPSLPSMCILYNNKNNVLRKCEFIFFVGYM